MIDIHLDTLIAAIEHGDKELALKSLDDVRDDIEDMSGEPWSKQAASQDRLQDGLQDGSPVSPVLGAMTWEEARESGWGDLHSAMMVLVNAGIDERNKSFVTQMALSHLVRSVCKSALIARVINRLVKVIVE